MTGAIVRVRNFREFRRVLCVSRHTHPDKMLMNRRYLHLRVLFVLFFYFATSSPELISQLPAGKEFVVALPSFWRRTDPVDPGRLELTILASRRTNVSIKWSGPNGSVLDQATLNEGDRLTFSSGIKFQIFNFVQLLENRDPQEVNQRSFYIESDNPVSVIATYDDYRASGSVTETWAVAPIESYGTDYSVLTYSGSASSNTGFLIMAAEDSTTVTFDPSVLWDTPSDGTTTPVSKLLRQYQVFQVYSNSPESMSGSTVTADKPIGVLPFSRRTNAHIIEPFDTGNAYQTTWRQSALADVMPSHDFAGTRFYTMPFAPHDTSQVLVIATEDGTEIRRNGTVVGTIDATEFLDIDIGEPSRIDASKPIMATQIARSGNNPLIDTVLVLDASKPNERDTIMKINGNPGMAWLPPVSQWKPTLHWTNPLLDQRKTPIPGKDSIVLYPWIHYALVTTTPSIAPSVRIDGQPVEFDYNHFDGSMVSAVVPVLPRPHLLTSDGPVSCLAYGFAYNDGYAMVSSEALRSIARIDVASIDTTTCDTLLDVFFELTNVGNNGYQIDSVTADGIEIRSVRQPLAFPTQMPPERVLQGQIVVRLPEARTYTGTLFVYTDANNTKVLEIPFRITRDSARLTTVDALDFGQLGAGLTEKDTTITITNNGDRPVTIDALSTTDPRFTIVAPSTPREIQAGGSLAVTVRLTPRSGVAESGQLLIDGTPCVTPIRIPLSGFQGAGALLGIVRTLRFPAFLCDGQAGADTTIVISSIGDEPLDLKNIRITGANAPFFTLTRNPAPRVIPPGQSDTIGVRYLPGIFGRHQASLEIGTNSVNAPDPLVIPLSGALDTAMAEPQQRRIVIPAILGCDDPVDVQVRYVNGGTVDADITGASLVDGSQFSITSATTFSIPPGGIERTVGLRFEPQAAGRFSDTLILVGGPCGIEERVVIEGERIDPELSAAATSIDLGALVICSDGETPMATGTITLRNDGQITDSIQRVTPTGDAGFDLEDVTYPIVLEPGAERSIEVRFTASTSGDYSSTWTFLSQPCDVEVAIDVAVRVDRVSWTVDPTTLDFGTVDVGDPEVTRDVTLRNDGTLPRSIDASGLAAPFRVVSPTGTITIPAGGEVTVTIGFLPNDSGTFSSTLRLGAGDPCAAEQTVAVTAVGRGEEEIAVDFTIDVPDDVQGEIDQTIEIPIRSLGSSTAPSGAITEIEMVLRFPAALLYPIEMRAGDPGVSTSIVSNTIVGDTRVLRLRVTGSEIIGGKVLGRLAVTTLLGDADEAVLDLDSASVVSTAPYVVSTQLDDGLYRAIGICELDGTRLVTSGTFLRIAPIRPNPTGGIVTVHFATSGEGRHRLRLYDATGDLAAALDLGDLDEGGYATEVDLSTLPNGIYLLEVRNDRINQTQSLIVRN